MIAEFFIWVLGGTARLLFSLFPGGDGPDVVASGVQQGIGTVLGLAGQFGTWVPWFAVAPVVALVLGTLVVSGVIKLVRILASFLTLGGGSAA